MPVGRAGLLASSSRVIRLMHVIELSNHPGDLLDDASRRRVAAEKQALSVYQDALIRYRARVQTIKVKRDRARAQRRWGTWLRLAFAGWKEKRGVPRPPIPAAGHTDPKKSSWPGSRASNWSRPSWAARWTTTGRCCTGTATGAARSTTCCSARRDCSRSR